jgi:hypothetical protein
VGRPRGRPDRHIRRRLLDLLDDRTGQTRQQALDAVKIARRA